MLWDVVVVTVGTVGIQVVVPLMMQPVAGRVRMRWRDMAIARVAVTRVTVALIPTIVGERGGGQSAGGEQAASQESCEA